MPLVQSIDLLRHQVVNPVFRGVLDDVHEKVRGGMALSDAFGDHGDLFPRVYTASLLAGERSGNLDAILRRYVAYEKVIDTVRRKTISALIYPVILIALAIGLVGIIVLRVVPAFSDFYASFDAELPLSTRIILGVSNFAQEQFLLIDGDRRDGQRGVRGLDSAAGAARAVRSRRADDSVRRRDGAQVRDGADGAHAGDAAGRRHPAGEFAGGDGAIGQQPPHGERARRGDAARPRRAGAGGVADGARRSCPMSR